MQCIAVTAMLPQTICVVLLFGIWLFAQHARCETTSTAEENAEIAAEKSHETDSTLLLVVVGLLVLSLLTIWLFKVKRFRWMHETGLCMIYGMLAGLIIKYAGGVTKPGYPSTLTNVTVAPQTLWVKLLATGRSYSYGLNGPLQRHKGGIDNLENKAVFDPEVFFYALLPPIIFFAGYDMKKRFFFRNLGAIIAFAVLGTTISCMVFGGIIYGFVLMVGSEHYKGFGFHECVLFGSLISATDTVTVLAILHDLNVDVDLYAMIFGESALNDAVTIVLYRSVQNYQNEAFHTVSFFKSVGEFVGVFVGSLLLGSACGLGTALITKLTHIKQFPKLETALFTMMSYSTFLLGEVLGLTGIVAVLFCGISQAHYTYNNMSKESQVATKEIFGLLNFLAESFIFVYMGLSIFTYEQHQWRPGFICWAFVAVVIGRFLNIYPLSFLLNLKRSKKIPWNFQHMLFFAGLRGSVAFALAIRNTSTEARQLMLTTTLVIVVATVLVGGGLTTQALMRLKIRVNVDPDQEVSTEIQVYSSGMHEDISYERSFLVRKWHAFDVRFMIPLFTSKGGSAYDALPQCCGPFARCLTSPELRQQHYEESQRQRLSTEDLRSTDDEMLIVDGRSSPDSLDHSAQREEALTIVDQVDRLPARLEFEMEAKT